MSVGDAMFGMDIGFIAALVALGAMGGFLAGLLGIGGGMTIVPMLTLVFTPLSTSGAALAMVPSPPMTMMASS